MPTSDITIIGTAKDAVTVSNPSFLYRPVRVKGDRYIVNLRAPKPQKRK